MALCYSGAEKIELNWRVRTLIQIAMLKSCEDLAAVLQFLVHSTALHCTALHCTALKMTRLWYLYHSLCSYWFVQAIILEDKHHNAEDSINLIKEQTQLLSA